MNFKLAQNEILTITPFGGSPDRVVTETELATKEPSRALTYITTEESGVETTTAYDWSGVLDRPTLIAAGLADQGYEWLKTVTKVEIGTKITGLGEGAYAVFGGCESLTSVTIPESVTNIDLGSFESCGLTSVVIPGSVRQIGEAAFKDCDCLTSVAIGDGVTIIFDNAFEGCSDLVSVSIPASVTRIGWAAFRGCEALTSVTIPASVTSIERNAFEGCSSLTSIIFEGKTIDQVNAMNPNPSAWGVTQGCTISTWNDASQEWVRETMQPAGDYALRSELPVIDSTLSVQGAAADAKATGDALLDAIQFKEWFPGGEAKSIADCTPNLKFDWANADNVNHTVEVLSFATDGVTPSNGDAVGDIVIPPYVEREGVRYTVTAIGDYGDQGSPLGAAITSLKAPTTVTQIGYGAFFYCTSLTSASLPAATTIKSSAFDFCTNLTSISLPAATDIGEASFYNCASLTSVDFGPDARTSVPVLGNGALPDPTQSGHLCHIIIPDTQYAEWMAASSWSALTSKGYVFVRHSETEEWGPYVKLNGRGFSEWMILRNGVDVTAQIASGDMPYFDAPADEWQIFDCHISGDVCDHYVPNPNTSDTGALELHWTAGNETVSYTATRTVIPGYVLGPLDGINAEMPLQSALTFDHTPTENSSNPVTSDGIKRALEAVNITPLAGNTYDCSTNAGYYRAIEDVVRALGGTITNSPFSPTPSNRTTLYFDDGTSESYDWSGELNQQKMIDAGLFDEDEGSWTKTITKADIGIDVTSIGWGAFDDCNGLTSVMIPDSVISIARYAFRNCSGLASVTIPGSMTSIGDYAFWGCSSLTSVTIPDSMTSIGEGAFWGCNVLTTAAIPESVTTIGNGAFDSCTSLTALTFEGKTLAQVQAMDNYPWGVDPEYIHANG